MKTPDQQHITEDLGRELHKQFTLAKSDRLAVEQRWLADLRQFKGVYSEEELARIPNGKSRTHTRITRIKVKSATAKLMDLIFPAGTADNWEFLPTPVSDVVPSPQVMQALTSQLLRMPSEDEIRIAVNEQAKKACKLMEQEVRDQLVEAKYRKLMKHVVNSGNLFGTGILKGPLVNRTYKKTWVMGDTGDWTLVSTPVLSPFIEFTPVWEMYPESLATSFSEARYNFQRSIMTKHAVIELSSRQDFSRSAIREYLKDHPDGDTQMLDWELELRRLGWNLTGNTTKGKRYEVLEYWGVLDAKKLIDMGLDVPDDSQEEFWANVWLLGDKVIKIEVQPIDGMQLPYFAYYWDKDETSIFGEGIPSVIRDDDQALNASTRALLDNAAICAGPILEANVDLMMPDEDPRDIHPFKVFLRSGVGVEAQYPAVREIQLNSHTQEYMALAQHFASNIHESTIPSYMHGEATSKGSVGRTASGLSMLMSAAQVTFKDQLLSIDDDVQSPFLEAAYHWNMQFNTKQDIKGDFNVHVKGTSSLVAREIRATNLDAFANSTLNQFDGPYIDRQALNKERAVILELGQNIVLDEEQAIIRMTRQAMANGNQQTGAPQGAQPSNPGPTAQPSLAGNVQPNQIPGAQAESAGPPAGDIYSGPGASPAGEMAGPGGNY
jgi:hypothetical protein